MSFATRAACASMFALAPLAGIAGTMPDPIFADAFEGDCANGTETPAALETRWRDAIGSSLDAQCIQGSTFGDIANGGEYCLEDQGSCVAGCDVAFVPMAGARDWTTTFDLDMAWQGGAVIPIDYRIFGMPSSCTLTVNFTAGIIGHRFTYTAQPPTTALDLTFAQADDVPATTQLLGCQALLTFAGDTVDKILADALAGLSQAAVQAGGPALAGRDACPAPLP